ncbi:MAG TPA: hypothetical protein VK666_21110 [Chryseolinea sp.]|nr:hypothetical protein [Chryseolinea sp.]
MKRALLFICLSYGMLGMSQAPGIEWTKLYGNPSYFDETVDVDTDAEANVYMGGTLKVKELDARIRLVKYNSAGAQIWSAIFTPAAKYVQAHLKAMNVGFPEFTFRTARIQRVEVLF